MTWLTLAQVAKFGPVTHWCREATWTHVHGSLMVLALGLLVLLASPPMGALVLVGAALALSFSWRRPMYRDRNVRVETKKGALFVAGCPMVTKAARVVIVRDGEIHRVQVFDGNARYPRVTVTTYSADEAERLRASLMAAEPPPALPDPNERFRVGMQRMAEVGYRGASPEQTQELQEDEDARMKA